jgi:hypothetical protein
MINDFKTYFGNGRGQSCYRFDEEPKGIDYVEEGIR